MKILLINPMLGADYSALDIGITSLATYINQKTKHEAGILDFTFHQRSWKRHLHRRIARENPDIIGISCSSLYMEYVRKIAREIKRRHGTHILLGGCHPTLEPEGSISIRHCDSICIGDGEHALSEYLDALESGKGAKGIHGIWAKEGGKIIRNPKRPLIDDINSLPAPDWSLWEDLDKYHYFLNMQYFIGTRGCPYNCSNCSELPLRKAVPGKHFRVRNPRAYAAEIKQQYEMSNRKGSRKRSFLAAHLFDPVFTFNKKWVKEFCDEYIKLGMAKRLPYSIFARADNLDEEIVQTLAKGGCRVVRIGIESGNEWMRNEVYEKKVSTEQVRKAIALSKKYGLVITGYFMVGGPGETKKTLNDTFRLAKELDVHRPAFFVFTPIPQTSSIEKIKKYGSSINSRRAIQVDNFTFGAVVETGDLTVRKIEGYQHRFYFYFGMRRIFRLIKRKKLRYFTELAVYITKGLYYGLSLKYLLPYFHIMAYDNCIN